jgi:hypothetical protein
MMKRKLGAMLGLAVLLSPVNQAALAAGCTGLVGKWRVTYTLTDTFRDTLTIKKVSPSGSISGVDQFGIPIHGDCKNNTVFLIEDFGNEVLSSWNFTSAGPRFARYWGVITGERDDFVSVRVQATARKISNSSLKSSASEEFEGATKRAQLEEYHRSRHSQP